MDVLTPDFYNYPWTPILSFDHYENYLDLRWDDQTSLTCFILWLRENAIGAGGIDQATREGIFEPSDLNQNIKPKNVQLTDKGALSITWDPNSQQALYHPGWLKHIALNQHGVNSWLPKVTTWSAQEQPMPKVFEALSVLDCRTTKKEWLNTLLESGTAKLVNAPLEENFLGKIAHEMGPIRETNFGSIWDVKADITYAGNAETNSTANTSLSLSPHTDLPTRETPPGFQFLHCLKNETDGGESTMSDGYAIVETIRQEWPEDYKSLTTLNWIFFNRGPGIDHRWSGPIIEPERFGRPLTLRAFYPVRAFPDMPLEKVSAAYSALQRFYSLASNDGFQIQFPFKAGDILCFDNRRILHGRNAFSGSGQRHLRGIYLDRDEVMSCTRVINRYP